MIYEIPFLKPFMALLFISLLTFVLQYGAPILQPLALATFLALILQMPVAAAEERGFPRYLAVFAVTFVILLSGVGIYRFALVPAQQMIMETPELETELRSKMLELRRSFRGAQDATKNIKKAAEEVTAMVADDKVQEVVVREPGFLSSAALSFFEILSIFALTVVFTSFLLAARRPFLILATLPFSGFTSKRHAAQTWRDAEHKLAHYFLVTTIINTGLGFAVGLSLWALGMPSPALWGVAAGLLNFIPFAGLFVGATALALVSIITYDTLFLAMLPPAAYLFINLIEANFVTPSMIGNRMKMAPIAVVLALTYCGWVWGMVGLLLAVPLLVLIKAVSDESPKLVPLRRMLTRRV